MLIPTATSFTSARDKAQERADATAEPWAIYRQDGAVFIGPIRDNPPDIVEVVPPRPAA